MSTEKNGKIQHQEPKDITVREAQANDASDIADVFSAAFAPLRAIYRPTSEAVARQAQHAEEETQLVAEREGQIVGTVRFVLQEDHIHVIGLAVHPDFQQQGVARRLIEWLAVRTKTVGRNLMTLYTIKETGNVPLFEKMKFKVVLEHTATWCIGANAVKLREVKMERRIV